MDYYLSFLDEASAKAVLYRIEGAVEANAEMGIEAVEGTEVQNFINIDTIGVIYKTTGEDSQEPLAGWHVNVRLMDNEDGSTLEPFAVTPSTPLRIWGLING